LLLSGAVVLKMLDTARINIFLNDVQIVQNGGRAASYSEEQGQSAMNPEDIEIRVELQRGAVSETVWTCDFSHDYVTINADYRS
jgi:glutamate N-acetyltransferase/amino-acid N-acetyltransferase